MEDTVKNDAEPRDFKTFVTGTCVVKRGFVLNPAVTYAVYSHNSLPLIRE